MKVCHSKNWIPRRMVYFASCHSKTLHHFVPIERCTSQTRGFDSAAWVEFWRSCLSIAIKNGFCSHWCISHTLILKWLSSCHISLLMMIPTKKSPQSYALTVHYPVLTIQIESQNICPDSDLRIVKTLCILLSILFPIPRQKACYVTSPLCHPLIKLFLGCTCSISQSASNDASLTVVLSNGWGVVNVHLDWDACGMWQLLNSILGSTFSWILSAHQAIL